VLPDGKVVLKEYEVQLFEGRGAIAVPPGKIASASSAISADTCIPAWGGMSERRIKRGLQGGG